MSKYITVVEGHVIENPLYNQWIMINQNLASALYVIISLAILPYILSLDNYAEIWLTIEKRLQSMNPAWIIQIKNELHTLSMGNKSMTQYLSDVKAKVDLVATSGSVISNEHVIYYTLNGLPHRIKNLRQQSVQAYSHLTLMISTLLCTPKNPSRQAKQLEMRQECKLHWLLTVADTGEYHLQLLAPTMVNPIHIEA